MARGLNKLTSMAFRSARKATDDVVGRRVRRAAVGFARKAVSKRGGGRGKKQRGSRSRGGTGGGGGGAMPAAARALGRTAERALQTEMAVFRDARYGVLPLEDHVLLTDFTLHGYFRLMTTTFNIDSSSTGSKCYYIAPGRISNLYTHGTLTANDFPVTAYNGFVAADDYAALNNTNVRVIAGWTQLMPLQGNDADRAGNMNITHFYPDAVTFNAGDTPSTYSVAGLVNSEDIGIASFPGACIPFLRQAVPEELTPQNDNTVGPFCWQCIRVRGAKASTPIFSCVVRQLVFISPPVGSTIPVRHYTPDASTRAVWDEVVAMTQAVANDAGYLPTPDPHEAFEMLAAL
jgi:hypothetical protein